MLVFGLTGGIASGKSTVTKTFLANNIPMVDADLIARDVVAPGTKTLSLIVDIFGPQYLLDDGTLDRVNFGKMAFADKNILARVTSIMMPVIQQEADARISKLKSEGHELVGYDAALICEQGNADNYRPLIVVACPTTLQVSRLMKRNSLTEAEAMHRIEAQMPTEQKIKLANFVIDSSGTIENSVQQTVEVIKILRSMI
jgi:dephospho-CoA kinase